LGVKNEDVIRSSGQIHQLAVPSDFYLKPGLSRSNAYEYSIIGLFVCTVVLSVTDLVTTSIALSSGLREGNVMLLAVESLLKMSFFQTIATTKLAFISGTAFLALIGMKSNVLTTRKIVFSSLAVFVVILLFVSVNNLLMINL
jgi:hypothetical protein